MSKNVIYAIVGVVVIVAAYFVYQGMQEPQIEGTGAGAPAATAPAPAPTQ
jgi:hypothetical protein